MSLIKKLFPESSQTCTNTIPNELGNREENLNLQTVRGGSATMNVEIGPRNYP
ncbi:MAG: hypothetical protein ACM3SY_19935 [Candidatus Omnitrophota bacterium]